MMAKSGYISCSIRWIKKRQHTIKITLLYIMWFLFIAVCIFLALLLWIMVMLLRTPRTGYAYNDDKFALYKNTRFEECVRQDSVHVDCSAILFRGLVDINVPRNEPYIETDKTKEELERNLTEPIGTIFKSRHSYYAVGESHLLRSTFVDEQHHALFDLNPQLPAYDWCSLATCLKNFKILPSTPYDSAFGTDAFIPILVWGWLNMAAASGLWVLIGALHDRHTEKPCPGPGVLDWTFWIYNSTMFVFWIYKYAVMASDEKFTTTSVNLIAWATPYFTAVSMFSHPIACRYHKSKAQAFAVTFLLMLVLAQYIATWIWNTRTANGVLQQDRSYNFAPKYRCLESKIAQAPGVTTCSTQELCSLNYLFKAENYITNRPELALPLNLSSSLRIIHSVVGSFVIMATLFAAVAVAYWSEKRQKLSYRGIGFLYFGVLLFTSALTVSTFLRGREVIENVLYYNKAGAPIRQSVLAFDQNCTAVHVTMSDWRYYMDIGVDRGMRAARIWLGA